jgi:putative membrane protein
MSGSWGAWPIWWALWWLVPLGLFVFFVASRGRWHQSSRWHSMGGRQPLSHESAVAILKERFARGEIDEDEYMRRRATLDAN